MKSGSRDWETSITSDPGNKALYNVLPLKIETVRKTLLIDLKNLFSFDGILDKPTGLYTKQVLSVLFTTEEKDIVKSLIT